MKKGALAPIIQFKNVCVKPFAGTVIPSKRNTGEPLTLCGASNPAILFVKVITFQDLKLTIELYSPQILQ